MDSSARCRISATTSVGRSAKAASMAITSLVLGTVGSSIASPAWASLDLKRIACQRSPSRSRAAAYSSTSRRAKAPHQPHPLSRKPERSPGPLRLAGISTTIMDTTNPRFSGSDHLLDRALKSAADLGADTRLIRLNDLKFRACEGYYSKAARACTWPCSITQMDASDELERVYDAFVHWADAIIVASPIRWGTASSLYFKMAERINCVQNQITIANRVLIRSKVAGFIIVGGQDNIQMVAGQMLGFFAELGFIFPQFPFIAHSRGWSHEDMENNVAIVQKSKELAAGACMLAKRLLDLAGRLIAQDEAPASIERGGRKANPV